MKTAPKSLGSRCALILRRMHLKPAGLSHGQIARLIDQCAKRN
jgi:hypothetical protein